MKKLAILFVPLVLVLQMPICPFRYLPQDWVNTYEYGKKWSSVLVSLYLDSMIGNHAPVKQLIPAQLRAKCSDDVMKFKHETEQWRVETQVRILRFEIPAQQASLHFATRCERL